MKLLKRVSDWGQPRLLWLWKAIERPRATFFVALAGLLLTGVAVYVARDIGQRQLKIQQDQENRQLADLNAKPNIEVSIPERWSSKGNVGDFDKIRMPVAEAAHLRLAVKNVGDGPLKQPVVQVGISPKSAGSMLPASPLDQTVPEYVVVNLESQYPIEPFSVVHHDYRYSIPLSVKYAGMAVKVFCMVQGYGVRPFGPFAVEISFEP